MTKGSVYGYKRDKFVVPHGYEESSTDGSSSMKSRRQSRQQSRLQSRQQKVKAGKKEVVGAPKRGRPSRNTVRLPPGVPARLVDLSGQGPRSVPWQVSEVLRALCPAVYPCVEMLAKGEDFMRKILFSDEKIFRLYQEKGTGKWMKPNETNFVKNADWTV